jgi:hypothetical protein
MNFIEHIHEPKRLLLVWQAAELPRTRRAVAELVQPAAASSRVMFRYLIDTADFQLAQQEGFVAFPAFRKTDQSYDLGVIETFARRLPPRTRGDYSQYLEQFRLRSDTSITDMALLGYTGAKLPSDGFSILDPLEDVLKPCEMMIEVAGFRHTATISRDQLAIGSRAALREEPDNPYDANALAVYLGEQRIGHVPRQQATALRALMRNNALEMMIERINGQPERPLVYLFARIRPHAISSELRRG